MSLRIALGLVIALLVTPAFGQAVQQPTFRQFTASTTVSVPDQGRTFLGGVRSASEGSVSRGVPMLSNIPGVNRLFRNRSIGREMGSRNLWATARIINLDEMDEAVLAAARNRRGYDTSLAGDPAVQNKAAFLSRNITRGSLDSPEPALVINKKPEPTVEEIRRQNELAAANQYREAMKFVDQGKAAEADGKHGVAKIYYQMAARRSSGQLKSHILARIDYLDTLKNVGTIAAK